MALSKRLIVVGGGAAGFFAAINAKLLSSHLEVIILEATPRLLTKVKISGGGRCNVTHSCFDPYDLVNHYPRGRRELLGPFSQFQPQDTVRWFRDRGINLKTEADGRMFPETNSSQTIIDCFLEQARLLEVKVQKSTMVKSISRRDRQFILDLGKQGEATCDYLLMATGSAPLGHKLLAHLGHKIVAPVPSLFTFCISDPLIHDLPGLSFVNVQLKLLVGGKSFKQQGPLLITHWGLSGPAVLKLSAFAARELAEQNYHARLKLNFLAMDENRCLQMLQESKAHFKQRLMLRDSPFPLPKRFWQRIVEISGNEGRTWQQGGSKSLRLIARVLTATELEITGKGEFKVEFVTAGGVALKEVNFKTMESKKIPGLYLAGEVLDIDGITGGFNFQNAWTGAWICAKSVVKEVWGP